MKVERRRSVLSSLMLGAMLMGTGSSAIAQASAPPAGQVRGAQLQSWLDKKFSYAGVHHASKCYFMNSASTSGRVLFMSCPDGWSAKIDGTARVTGDTLCTNFPIPNTPPGEECLSWHAMGDSRLEQRNGTLTSTTLYLLPAVPMK